MDAGRAADLDAFPIPDVERSVGARATWCVVKNDVRWSRNYHGCTYRRVAQRPGVPVAVVVRIVRIRAASFLVTEDAERGAVDPGSGMRVCAPKRLRVRP